MKCQLCGGPTATARENVHYAASGLPYVTLVGVKVTRCSNCGAFGVDIPSVEELHRTLAVAVVTKRARLVPVEVRFLRKWLGWSGVECAAHMGVTSETVSRWEAGSLGVGASADRLLRLMVVNRAPVQDYSLESLKTIGDSTSRPFRLAVKADRKGWRLVAT